MANDRLSPRFAIPLNSSLVLSLPKDRGSVGPLLSAHPMGYNGAPWRRAARTVTWTLRNHTLQGRVLLLA